MVLKSKPLPAYNLCFHQWLVTTTLLPAPSLWLWDHLSPEVPRRDAPDCELMTLWNIPHLSLAGDSTWRVLLWSFIPTTFKAQSTAELPTPASISCFIVFSFLGSVLQRAGGTIKWWSWGCQHVCTGTLLSQGNRCWCRGSSWEGCTPGLPSSHCMPSWASAHLCFGDAPASFFPTYLLWLGLPLSPLCMSKAHSL